MKNLFIFLGIFCVSLFSVYAQDAEDIVRKSEEKMRGESSKTVMTMEIVRPGWKRTISFKSWTQGNDYSLTLITAPAKEKGQTFLKRKNELWNYVPSIDRMVKLPPSMMSQGWMGSDFSNDDIIKEFSLVEDYNHSIAGSATIEGMECHKIKLQPKEGAAVVWGKMLKWITKDGYYQLKTEYYDEDGYLMKTETATDIRLMDDRKIPVHFEIIPADEPGNKTVLTMEDAEFDIAITPKFFSKQNMKRIR